MPLSARRKLNSPFSAGILLAAAPVGRLFQTWLADWGVVILLGVVAFKAGLIRVGPTTPANRPPATRPVAGRNIRRG